MTSARALGLLILRLMVILAMPVAVFLAPNSTFVIFLFGIILILGLQAMVQVPLSRVHRHIYFAASAACFSTVCAFGLFAVANRGSQWWLLVALTAFFCVMLLTLARSIYGPHSKV